MNTDNPSGQPLKDINTAKEPKVKMLGTQILYNSDVSLTDHAIEVTKGK